MPLSCSGSLSALLVCNFTYCFVRELSLNFNKMFLFQFPSSFFTYTIHSFETHIWPGPIASWRSSMTTHWSGSSLRSWNDIHVHKSSKFRISCTIFKAFFFILREISRASDHTTNQNGYEEPISHYPCFSSASIEQIHNCATPCLSRITQFTSHIFVSVVDLGIEVRASHL